MVAAFEQKSLCLGGFRSELTSSVHFPAFYSHIPAFHIDKAAFYPALSLVARVGNRENRIYFTITNSHQDTLVLSLPSIQGNSQHFQKA